MVKSPSLVPNIHVKKFPTASNSNLQGIWQLLLLSSKGTYILMCTYRNTPPYTCKWKQNKMFNNRKFRLSSLRNFKTTKLASYACIQVCLLLKMKPRSQVFPIQTLQEVTSCLSTPSKTICWVYSLAQHWTYTSKELMNHSCSTVTSMAMPMLQVRITRNWNQVSHHLNTFYKTCFQHFCLSFQFWMLGIDFWRNDN